MCVKRKNRFSWIQFLKLFETGTITLFKQTCSRKKRYLPPYGIEKWSLLVAIFRFLVTLKTSVTGVRVKSKTNRFPRSGTLHLIEFMKHICVVGTGGGTPWPRTPS